MENADRSHVWFCETCKTRGSMSGYYTIDLIIAREQHRIATINCSGDIRIIPESALKDNPEISNYQNWLD